MIKHNKKRTWLEKEYVIKDSKNSLILERIC